MLIFNKNKRINSIYLMHSIQGLAFSMIGIFIPIYLLTLKFSISQVILFFIIFYIAGALFSFLAIYISKKTNLQQTIKIRFLFLFIYLILLHLLQYYNIPIFFIAILGGLQNALYWIPLHILFAQNANKKNMGSSTSKLFAFPQIASMLGPLLGGFITVFFGFTYLFLTVFLILFISVIPLANAKTIKAKFEFRFSVGIKLFKKYPKYFFAEIFGNMGDEIDAIIWPIFIYLNLASIASVGIAGSLLAIGSIIFTLLIGRVSDKYKKLTLVKVGAITLFLVFIFKYFAQNELDIYILTILSGFFMVLFWVPLTSKIYNIAKKDKLDEFIVFREIPVVIGRLIILCVALLLVNNIQIIFPITALSYIYFLFL